MTPPPEPLDQSSPAAAPRLDEATSRLSSHSGRRAAEVADDVLRTVLRSSRRSLPVRVAAPSDNLWVADLVIIALLRRDIDTALVGGAVGRIHLDVDRGQLLRQLTIELYVQYGRQLLTLADQVRSIADATLSQLLTAADPAVALVVSHLHISAITVTDPHLVDPSDE